MDELTTEARRTRRCTEWIWGLDRPVRFAARACAGENLKGLKNGKLLLGGDWDWIDLLGLQQGHVQGRTKKV